LATLSGIRKFPIFIAIVLGCLAGFGCAQTPPLGVWEGPSRKVDFSVTDAQYVLPRVKTRLIRTQHYKIFTTIDDWPDMPMRLSQLMEGALGMYCQLAPDVKPTEFPMDCYLFANRGQWREFTATHTGVDATIYLQINRGGYTVHDWYVAYNVGDEATYSISSHEGWHQFVARHFRGRLPPFLEEGLACLFEEVRWDGDLPRWNLSINRARCVALRNAIDQQELFPLRQLVAMHAGQVVSLPIGRIAAFYAQDWAFARFLREGEGGKYRPMLQKILSDAASGDLYDPTASHRYAYQGWNPAAVAPMLEHYLGISLDEMDGEYQAYIHKVGYEELEAQSWTVDRNRLSH
jgi:hypothetical protein